MKTLEERAAEEVELIEQDKNLSEREKRDAIRQIRIDLMEAQQDHFV